MPLTHATPAASVCAWLSASNRHTPLAERTVLELSRRIQRWQHHPEGPAKAPAAVRRSALRARDRLVSHNLRLVSHTWGRHRHSLPASDEATADALQEGALNLLRAAEKYDPARGYRFSTYATFWVRRGFAEIEQRGKRAIRFPAEKAALVLKVQRLSQSQEAATGRPPSLAWLAGQCHRHGKTLSAKGLAALLQQWQLTRTGSLEAFSADGEDTCSSKRSQRLEQASLRLAEESHEEDDPQLAVLPQLLEGLDPQELEVIRGLYLREPALSKAQLRRALGLTAEELQTVEQRALARMRATAHALLKSAGQ
jgi:RNA polymerase sigma factor (sigma-70 family)